MQSLTPIVKRLIIVNAVLYFLFFLLGAYDPGGRSFNPSSNIGIFYGEYFQLHKSSAIVDRSRSGDPFFFQPIQAITYAFSHGSIGHLFFNMLGLFFLGPAVERVLGSGRFFKFYLFCGIFAGLMLAFLDPSSYPVVGASAAISGIIAGFAFLFPEQRLGFLFIPVSFKAKHFAMGIAAISTIYVVLEIRGVSGLGNISHFGHLMGMVGAAVFYYLGKYIPFLDQ